MHVYVYYVGMPNVTIYLDSELAERVRQAEVSVSPICQKALRLAVAEKEGAEWDWCPHCGESRLILSEDEQ